MPELLVIAGPNGSGKSTLTILLRDDIGFDRYNYVNADEMAKTFPGEYHEVNLKAAKTAEIIRNQLIFDSANLAFETVYSTQPKLDFITKAKGKGYNVSVIFVCTTNPDINIKRVKQRVREGGHDVPEDKIISRYSKSIEMMKKTYPIADNVYLFDNSADSKLVLEKVKGKVVFAAKELPVWTRKIIGS